MVAPASRFSNTADTGIRVSRNTHAPLRLPGTLSTAGHWDQSRVAMFFALLFSFTTVRRRRHLQDVEIDETKFEDGGSRKVPQWLSRLAAFVDQGRHKHQGFDAVIA